MSTPQTPTGSPARPDKIALVLKGGGALSSCQAGVYDALSQAGYLPNLGGGISVGG